MILQGDRHPYITLQSIRNYQQALEESRELSLVDVLLRVQQLETEVARLRYQNAVPLSEDFTLPPALDDEANERMQAELRRRHPELYN